MLHIFSTTKVTPEMRSFYQCESVNPTGGGINTVNTVNPGGLPPPMPLPGPQNLVNKQVMSKLRSILINRIFAFILPLL